MNYDILVVGAGFTGCILAERFASVLGKKVLLIDARERLGGIACDEHDEYGVMVHRYGPHIFHTNSARVFEYLSQFTAWIPYEHRVLASVNGRLYPIPINRITVNRLYGLSLATDAETAAFYERCRERRSPIRNSEDIIVNQVGTDLFERFFRHYTRKQWNLEPKELPPEVCGRIPVRTNEDSRYFTDAFQYMPRDGYSEMFRRMTAHPNIEIALSTSLQSAEKSVRFNKMIYTGPIDAYFDCMHGKLPYRSLRFEFQHLEQEEFQQTAQVNYPSLDVDFTRITEFKKLTAQNISSTTIAREYPAAEGEPFYPIPTKANEQLASAYTAEAAKLHNVVFAGRLATYRYINMDQAAALALKKFEELAR